MPYYPSIRNVNICGCEQSFLLFLSLSLSLFLSLSPFLSLSIYLSIYAKQEGMGWGGGGGGGHVFQIFNVNVLNRSYTIAEEMLQGYKGLYRESRWKTYLM